MVNPGGKSTMLGQWRIVLRQAEEAARLGAIEEAYALASRPDVADHHHAVQFRSRLALDLIARATRRGEVDDLAGAIDDLDLAERIGAPPDSLAAARLNLADRVADEVRADLDAGEPGRVLERIEDLARHKIGGPALRRAREIAEAWQNGLAEGRRGEFGRAHEQLDRAERLAAGAGAIAAQQAVAAAKVELETRQKAAAPKVEALYTALSEGKWPQILTAAEAVLTASPSIPPPARRGPGPGSRSPRSARPAAPGRTGPPERAQASPADRAGPAIPTPSLLRRPATEAADGIVWLSGGSNREPAERRSPRRRGRNRWRPQPVLRRPCRGAHRVPRRPGRWRESRPPGPRAGSCSGSTPSAAISSAWTTRSSSAGPGPTAMPTSR